MTAFTLASWTGIVLLSPILRDHAIDLIANGQGDAEFLSIEERDGAYVTNWNLAGTAIETRELKDHHPGVVRSLREPYECVAAA